MKTIYKYDLPMENRAIIPMPEGATILKVGVQHNKPVLWALVDSDAPVTDRVFFVFGTGHSFDLAEPFIHHGTLLLHGETFVGHVFEKT